MEFKEYVESQENLDESSRETVNTFKSYRFELERMNDIYKNLQSELMKYNGRCDANTVKKLLGSLKDHCQYVNTTRNAYEKACSDRDITPAHKDRIDIK